VVRACSGERSARPSSRLRRSIAVPLIPLRGPLGGGKVRHARDLADQVGQIGESGRLYVEGAADDDGSEATSSSSPRCDGMPGRQAHASSRWKGSKEGSGWRWRIEIRKRQERARCES
jgi:hypothetical protein